MKTKLLTILATSLICCGCSLVSFNDSGRVHSEKLAKLVNYRIDDRSIHIEVMSNGCTLISSFQLELADQQSNSIKVLQTKPDECRMKPIKMALDYGFRHLGIDPNRTVHVVNPITASAVAAGSVKSTSSRF